MSNRLTDAVVPRLQSAVAPPMRIGIALAGAALVVVGTLTPWATFAFGYPGKMTLSGFPGGARLYPLLLAPFAVLVLARISGRRRSGLLAAWGVIGITGFNVLALAFAHRFPLELLDDPDGGGLGAVAYGAWLTLAGGILLLVAFLSLPAAADDDPEFAPALPSVVELLIIAGVLGGVLFTFVLGLRVEETSRFISFVALLTFAGLALSRIGLFVWVSGIFTKHRTITVFAAALTAFLFPFTQAGNAYWIRVFASIGVFAAAAIGLNIVVGLAGLLDLGYIAFFGVGAYVGALFAGAARSTSGCTCRSCS